ncbi:hypothetical protein LO762_06470 [Actinocorallia sp. API 0066]|uniref:hypothetical protein n=1 Tax=Actinocorallia sp. API 0066 TaxID=2896846 RepID=UPI001E3785AE|nr:hypothetical protein [Actinocorallia sp. API 0066]MCD0448836.1 hypothetical protein [Actinocorallia sp. API 0066]
MSASSFARGLMVAGALVGGVLVAAPAANASATTASTAPVTAPAGGGPYWCDGWGGYCDFDDWWYGDSWGYYYW